MIIDLLLIALGVIMVIYGANILTKGSVTLAGRLGIPQVVIGMTIIAIGTSLPEFCVSLMSSIKGTSNMALGNVIGSNIFNEYLIVGMSAVFTPIVITKATIRRDIPIALVASVLLFAFAANGSLSRAEAGVLFLLFIFYMLYTIYIARRNREKNANEGNTMGLQKCFLFITAGICCLIFGSDIFVDSASKVAGAFGISDAVIGLTIVAGGTSFPEFATSIVAARKGASSLAIGNVLGSNVFNILMIVGIDGILHPMNTSQLQILDYIILIAGMLLLWVFSYTRLTIQRWEGIIMALIFIIYIYSLIA